MKQPQVKLGPLGEAVVDQLRTRYNRGEINADGAWREIRRMLPLDPSPVHRMLHGQILSRR